MNRRTLILLLGLLWSVACLRSAEDSPAFVVQNQPVDPSTAAQRVPSDQTPAASRTPSVKLEGTVLSARLGDEPATVIDPHASAGCPPSLIAFADNSALLVWRGHGKDHLRDLRTARYIDGAWQASAVLNPDDWRTADVPLGEGPAVDARGAHVVVAWFTAAEGPRINVSTSANAGVQWLIPNRVDDVAPIGRVSVVLLDDGAQLVSWVERVANSYLILLRRVSSRGTLSVPVQLARLDADPGHPRLTRVKDGDATPAQLLLAYTERSAPAARLITLPDASLLAEADACDCDPRPEELRGYAVKGSVTAIDPKAGTLTLAHDDIPGVIKAAVTVFKAAPDVLVAAKPGKRVFARTERIGPDWWLFNLRLLITP